MARRRAALMLVAAVGLVLVLPVGIVAGWVAGAAGLANAEDAHGFEGLALALATGLALLSWLLVLVTSVVAYAGGARVQGKVFWAWAGVLALAAFVAAGMLLDGAWRLRDGFARDSVVHAALALWTAAAGVVAALWLPWGGQVPAAGAVAR